jgi:hypothetical protein
VNSGFTSAAFFTHQKLYVFLFVVIFSFHLLHFYKNHHIDFFLKGRNNPLHSFFCWYINTSKTTSLPFSNLFLFFFFCTKRMSASRFSKFPQEERPGLVASSALVTLRVQTN